MCQHMSHFLTHILAISVFLFFLIGLSRISDIRNLSIAVLQTSDRDKQSAMAPDIDKVITISEIGSPFVNVEGAFSLRRRLNCGFSPLEISADQGKSLFFGVFKINFVVFEHARVRLSIVIALQEAKLGESAPSKRHDRGGGFFWID